MSEQRTILRLRLEVRSLEYELTAARMWLSYQADHISRLENQLGSPPRSYAQPLTGMARTGDK